MLALSKLFRGLRREGVAPWHGDPTLARSLSLPSAAIKRGPPGTQAELPGYTMDRSMRIRINDFLAHNQSPVIN